MLNCPRDYLIILSFTDSHPTPGTVVRDSRLDMNPLMLANGPIEWGHVEAVSQPPMVS